MIVQSLRHRDGSTKSLQGGLQLLCVLLWHVLLQDLWGGLDELLGLDEVSCRLGITATRSGIRLTSTKFIFGIIALTSLMTFAF